MRHACKYLATIVLAAAAAACSGSPESAPSASGPVSTPVAREHVTRTIPRDQPSWVTVHALPNAECSFDAADPQAAASQGPAKPLALYSDGEGMVHFRSRATDARATSAAMRLDCTDSSGAHTSVDVDLVVDASAAPAPAPAARVTRERPALVGDPMTFSRQDLAARDFPPRPDPIAAPDSYEKWLELASHPVHVIEPNVVKTHRRHGSDNLGPATERTTSGGVHESSLWVVPNWNGYAIATPSTQYWYVYGTWNAPSTTNEGGFWSTAYSSEWVGLGMKDIVQDGTEADTSSRFWVESSANYAWYEWLPDDSYAFSNFPVSPGDQITAWAWMTDSDGTFDANGRYAKFMIYDGTQYNITIAGPYVMPAGVISTATASAEWIIERPDVGLGAGNYPDLANYGFSVMNDAWAEDWSTHGLHDYVSDDANATQIQMYDSDYNELSAVFPWDRGEMFFVWDHYN